MFFVDFRQFFLIIAKFEHVISVPAQLLLFCYVSVLRWQLLIHYGSFFHLSLFIIKQFSLFFLLISGFLLIIAKFEHVIFITTQFLLFCYICAPFPHLFIVYFS